MDKYIYDESNGLWYELQGDYYTPCLTLPAEKEHKPIGLWGHRHKRYLQEHKQSQGITEQLKTENTLEWVQRMNNIQACAREIVNKEIIFG